MSCEAIAVLLPAFPFFVMLVMVMIILVIMITIRMMTVTVMVMVMVRPVKNNELAIDHVFRSCRVLSC